MRYEERLARIALKHQVDVHAAEISGDATHLTGTPTLEVAATHQQYGPVTLYVREDDLELEWDVTGHPIWYRGPKEVN